MQISISVRFDDDIIHRFHYVRQVQYISKEKISQFCTGLREKIPHYLNFEI